LTTILFAFKVRLEEDENLKEGKRNEGNQEKINPKEEDKYIKYYNILLNNINISHYII
jgi:hypothetical protein